MSFNDRNIALWTADYEQVLTGNIDYEKLRVKMLYEHNTNYPPTTKWLYDAGNECRIKSDKCAAVQEIESWKYEEQSPPSRAFLDLKEKLKKAV